MQKCLKLAGPLVWNDTKNAKNSLLRRHGKMPKSRRSAVTKNCQKVAGPLSQKNAKNHRYVVREKMQ